MLAREYLKLKVTDGTVAYLGKETSTEYLHELGLKTLSVTNLDLDDIDDISVLVFMDDEGFDWNHDINKVVNLLRKRNIPSVVANTDWFYPVSKNDIAIAAGGIANMVEAKPDGAGILEISSLALNNSHAPEKIIKQHRAQEDRQRNPFPHPRDGFESIDGEQDRERRQGHDPRFAARWIEIADDAEQQPQPSQAKQNATIECPLPAVPNRQRGDPGQQSQQDYEQRDRGIPKRPKLFRGKDLGCDRALWIKVMQTTSDCVDTKQPIGGKDIMQDCLRHGEQRLER
jgi:hypothetical protein